MTSSRQRAAVLLLHRRAKKVATELLDEHRDPLTALVAFEGGQQLALGESSEERLDRDLDEIETQLAALADEHIELLTVLDDRYPPNLRTVHDRPLALWVHGELQERDQRSVAVVGTRQASDEGLRKAGEIAGQLAEAGYVVVSGLAAGVDSAAHMGALDAGGRTIAVIGTGLRHAFPKSNAPLQARLAEESAVISQFPLDQEPRRWTFPMRNAVMSGMARATVVVEASYTSGARMQARIALEHGRPIFLLPSLLEHEWARDYATRPGVHVVDDVDAVTALLDRLYAPDLTLTA